MSKKVKIAYQVKIENSIVEKELPFVIGALADLSGKPNYPLPDLRYRQFIEITQDNFNNVLGDINPRLAFRVDNLLTDDDTKMAVELKFKAMDDFQPERIIYQIDPLRKLFETREKLSLLLVNLENRPHFDNLLQEVYFSEKSLEKLAKELGIHAEPSESDKHPRRDRESSYPRNGESDSPNEKNVLRAGRYDLIPAGASAEELEELQTDEQSLLDQIIDMGKLASDESKRERAKDLIEEFVIQILEGQMIISKDTRAMINTRIVQIDRLISRLLNEIIHHPEFQRLEASWRGLYLVLEQTKNSDMIKVRVLNVNKRDLIRDFDRAGEFVCSSLFEKIYEEEFGTWGGEPFGVLIGDFEFTSHPQDLHLLKEISKVASVAKAPFISGLGPQLIGLDSFSELRFIRNLKIFLSTKDHYPYWQKFRSTKESNYVVLVFPRVLVRVPYKEDLNSKFFSFSENIDSVSESNFLWANAAYALASVLAKTFSRYHWFSAIQSVQNSGLFRGLTHFFFAGYGNEVQIGPTEISISDRLQAELLEEGLTPLVSQKRTKYSAFFNTQACYHPQIDDDYGVETCSTAEAPTQLQNILAISRFYHYINSIIRDYSGYFQSTVETEEYVNNWISNYIQKGEFESRDTEMVALLSEAKIKLLEEQNRPGAYAAQVLLTTFYQNQQPVCTSSELKIPPLNSIADKVNL